MLFFMLAFDEGFVESEHVDLCMLLLTCEIIYK